jgi:predicted nucleic acid-binding protein
MPTGSIAFADTNILLYAASPRSADKVKAVRARDLLRSQTLVISFQVLQEFYANAVNPRKLGFTPEAAYAFCRAWLELPIVTLDAPLFVRTLEFAQRYAIGNWDAAILAAAEKAGCEVVYTEDLSHGQRYFDVEVRNPFL